MHSINDVQKILNEIADEIPDDFFMHLNGGVILRSESKRHPEHPGLYVMGEYLCRRDMGRSIHIYYGSFMRLYARASESELKEHLRETLLHEFTHHIESLAGERGLEIKDSINMKRYKNENEKAHIRNDADK